MPTLQPFVSNTPLALAKNLRFQDANGLLVSQLLPIGMNGNIVADSPTTGYISRIGSVLSQQIDLYNDVANTLKSYQTDIYNLQQAVDALEISGTTIPIVNGYCFNGNANGYITDVVEDMAQALCPYIPVFGTSTALMQAIQAEGATALNVQPSYSIPAGTMQALSGWVSNPQTLASSVNNLWLSYLDSRTALTTMLNYITPSCSNNIVDFATHYNGGASAGIFVYISGYSFPAAAYTDNGSTITITDGLGGIYTTGINLVSKSQPGSDALFVGISGTPLDPTVGNYTVTLKSVLKSTSNNCTKTVVHNTGGDVKCKDCDSSNFYKIDSTVVQQVSGGALIPVDPDFKPRYVDIVALDEPTATKMAGGYLITIETDYTVSLNFIDQSSVTISFRWIAYK